MSKLKEYRVVVIADSVEIDKNSIDIFSRSKDRASAQNVQSLMLSLSKFSQKVILYKEPKDFVRNIEKHLNDLVFPYWHGANSRNRFGIVPAICESYNIKYVGGDAYSNLVCADKILSKDICRSAGMSYPRYFEKRLDDRSLKHFSLNFPVVVKPNFEGSSLGITQRNIVSNIEELMEVSNLLHKEFEYPLIIEEFIPGEEVSISIIGYKNNIKFWGAVKRKNVANEKYFDHALFDFYDKLNGDFEIQNAYELINNETINSVFQIFNSLDKIEFLRIDGKFFNNIFYCLELSNDPSLNPFGAFFTSFKYRGLTYDQGVKLLVENCLERYSSLYSS